MVVAFTRSSNKWEDPDQHVQMADLTSFFRSLYTDPTLNEDAKDDPEMLFSCSDYFASNPPPEAVLGDPMENPISFQEISFVLRKLSTGKATGLDNISNEMLKVAGDPCHLFLTNLFYSIYTSGVFPQPWKKACITILYKKGVNNDLANYRPISITSCFGSLY